MTLVRGMQWDLLDHLVQDYDPEKANYGSVADNPQLMDINFVPGNPRGGNRNDSATNPRGVKDCASRKWQGLCVCYRTYTWCGKRQGRT